MATQKTTWTDADPREFVAAVARPARRRDAHTMLDLMTRATGEPPRMFGTSIVGFGEYRFAYPTGRSGHAPAASFSPRTTATVVYLPDGVEAHADALAGLGPHTSSVGCLYLKDLATVDLDVLEQIVRDSSATLTADTFGRRAGEGGA
ncbi:DUF1801 domain-containing protein [Isoptericola sp. NEAU-Y5]|uniref:DUF1801 domain-containing protein n=1 Tax=Isoptericola luteus TaxID=2879484 RepID=A0ABS7ZFX1_9MICO|nr:DUF1801 domain-containing protein [Isoptericola sp. NEAU-Y5]MCA5893925.1 DUF1801 domain-containing protein [Isoptericola sp. NEAU-Y5]